MHYALAAYNAGDHRVAAWQRERPGMPQEVFIDDIPFPETQNYVKRILGTAEDYRRSVRHGGAAADAAERSAADAAAYRPAQIKGRQVGGEA